jgi:hypothetical protein
LFSHQYLALSRNDHFDDIGRVAGGAPKVRYRIANCAAFVGIASPSHGQARKPCQCEGHLVLFVRTGAIHDFHGIDVAEKLTPGHRPNWIGTPTLPVIPEWMGEDYQCARLRASQRGGLGHGGRLAKAAGKLRGNQRRRQDEQVIRSERQLNSRNEQLVATAVLVGYALRPRRKMFRDQCPIEPLGVERSGEHVGKER